MNSEIRNSTLAKDIEEDIRKKYGSGKLKDSHIKKFLKQYYDGDPTNDCPTGCKGTCPLECYIDIHKSLIDDDGNKRDFKELYVRDGAYHCCGKPTYELKRRTFCTVCGTEY